MVSCRHGRTRIGGITHPMIRTFILHAIHSGEMISVVISSVGMIITGGIATTAIIVITTMILTVMQAITATGMVTETGMMTVATTGVEPTTVIAATIEMHHTTNASLSGTRASMLEMTATATATGAVARMAGFHPGLRLETRHVEERAAEAKKRR